MQNLTIKLSLLVVNTDRYYFLLLNTTISNLNGADAFTSTKVSVVLHNNSLNCGSHGKPVMFVFNLES